MNNRFQLGLGEQHKNTNTRNPLLINYFRRNKTFILDVVASADHSMALDSNGNAYTWGANQVGRTPTEVKDAMGSVINYTMNMDKELFCEC
jgi:alpha-tubulin suppressor-like RCC1 family protein